MAISPQAQDLLIAAGIDDTEAQPLRDLTPMEAWTIWLAQKVLDKTAPAQLHEAHETFFATILTSAGGATLALSERLREAEQAALALCIFRADQFAQLPRKRQMDDLARALKISETVAEMRKLTF